MTPRTRLLVGLSAILLGVGAVAVGWTSGQPKVAYVEDLLADPAKYDGGSWTLLAVPQPAQVPVTRQAGVVLEDNPGHLNSTRSTVSWSHEGGTVYSRRTLQVEPMLGGWAWTYTNETRRLPSDPDPLWDPVVVAWTTQGGRVFPVEAFDDGDGDTPRIWAVYPGTLKEAMQPKPSQFTGHLWTHLPDGRPVPDGVSVYAVEPDGFKAGCSSKFLPPESEKKYGSEE